MTSGVARSIVSFGVAEIATVGTTPPPGRSAGGVGTTNPAPSPQAASEAAKSSAALPRTAGAADRRTDVLASDASRDSVLPSDRDGTASATSGRGRGRLRAISAVPRLASAGAREPRPDRDIGRRELPTKDGMDPTRPRPHATVP